MSRVEVVPTDTRSRRRDRHGAVALELVGRTAVTSSASIRRRRCSRRVDDASRSRRRRRRCACRKASAQAAVRRRHLRRADVHILAALCRRPGGDNARTCACRGARRFDRRSRVRSPVRLLAAALGILGSRRPATQLGSIRGGWHEVGDFLGPSISGFNERWPLRAARSSAWRAAGVEDVRVRRSQLGGGVVTWGRRDARLGPPSTPEARAGGGTTSRVLHLPYTAWNLSYVALGCRTRTALPSRPDALDDGGLRSSGSASPPTFSTS